MRQLFHSLFVAVALLVAQFAIAGVPLKGVDVKLGPNPGGSPAARTTDAQGNADFGVVPEGNYTVTVASAGGPVHAAVSGAAGGMVERDLTGGATQRAAPIAFAVDGKAAVVVKVTGAAGSSAPQIAVRGD